MYIYMVYTTKSVIKIGYTLQKASKKIARKRLISNFVNVSM